MKRPRSTAARLAAVALMCGPVACLSLQDADRCAIDSDCNPGRRCADGRCRGPAPVCGDGFAEEAHEGCDDGNDVSGDGCEPQCHRTAIAAIAAGGGFSCALRVGGTVNCWGANADQQAEPRPGRFVALSAGGRHACALDEGGQPSCWGSDVFGQSAPPAGRLKSIGAGWNHTCGLTAGGDVLCWGLGTAGAPPAGPFDLVAAGESITCARRSHERQLVCWGADFAPVPLPQSGAVAAFSVGPTAVCAVDDAGAGWCSAGAGAPPNTPLSQVAVARLFACGLTRAGTLTCWPHDRSATNPSTSAPTPPAGTFDALTAGESHACARRSAAASGAEAEPSVVCWGTSDRGQLGPPAGRFRQVAGASAGACGLRRDGHVVCWAGPHPPHPSSQLFDAIAVGSRFYCGVERGGAVLCRTHDAKEVPVDPLPNFSARTIAAAGLRACALAATGGLACFGVWSEGIPSDPGPFRQLALTGERLCAVRTTGEVTCWGGGPGLPPSLFAQIALGGRHGCGLSPASDVLCWGDDAVGQATPPSASPDDPFVELQAGAAHTCGRRRAGRLACWGEPGAAAPPGGRFAALASGLPCALRADGTLACWGAVKFDQASWP